MSMYVDIAVNSELIAGVAITRTTSGGEQPDSINTYRWTHARNGDTAVGFVEHRYGNGAIALAHKVLGEIAERHRIAQETNP